MIRWAVAFSICAALQLAPMAAAAEPTLEPAFVARLKPINGVISDLKYLAKLVGQESAASQLESVIDAWCGDQGLDGTGIDRARSICLYAIATSDASDSPFAIVIPLADETKFRSFLDSQRLKSEKNDDGSYALDLPNSPAPVFFRFANGCVYVTAMNKANLEPAKLINAEKLTVGVNESLIATSLRLDRIPDDVRQMLLGQIEMRLADLKEQKQPGESPEDARRRRQGIDFLMVVVKTLLSEGKSVEYQLTIDQKTNDIGQVLAIAGKPKSTMAVLIEALGGGTTRFAPAADAAFHVGLNFSVPDVLRVVINPFIQMGMKDAVVTESDPNKKAMMKKAMDAVAPTILDGVVDIHLAACTPNAGQTFNILAAIGVKEGDKIEATVRELISQLPGSEAAKINKDAAKIGEVKIHQIKLGELDDDGKRLIGSGASAWAGFSSSAIMLGLGGEAKSTYAGMTTNKPARLAPMFVIEGSLAKLALLDKHPVAIDVAKETFGSPPHEDHFRLSINGGPKLTVEATFKSRGLRFLQQLNERKKGD